MELTVTGKIWYACILSDEDSLQVLDYAKENDLSIEEAAMELYNKGEISFYEECVESDYSTENIELVETTYEEDYYLEHGCFPDDED